MSDARDTARIGLAVSLVTCDRALLDAAVTDGAALVRILDCHGDVAVVWRSRIDRQGALRV